MISDTKKKNIINKIMSGENINNFLEFLEDDDIAMAAIEEDVANIELIDRFKDKKDILEGLVKDGKGLALIYMTTELKNDFDFAKDMYAINPSVVHFFNKNVRYDQFFIDEALKNLNLNREYCPFLYHHHHDKFLDALSEQPKIYEKLPIKYREKKDIILTALKGKGANKYTVDYIGLKDEIKKDFDILIALLPHLSKSDIYYKAVANKIEPYIKNQEGINKFKKEYTGEYNDILMKVLFSNNDFKKKYKHLLEETKLKNYREKIREVDLLQVINEQTENSEPKVLRNKIKI